MNIEQHISQLLDQKFEEEGFKDCFLIEIKILRKKIEIFIDSDNGIDLVRCQRISRYIEPFLDETKEVPEDYELEVSSPGVTKPLKLQRQYHRNIGRELDLTLADTTTKRAFLKEVLDNAIRVEETIKVKEGKKNVKKVIETTIPLETIQKAIVRLKW